MSSDPSHRPRSERGRPPCSQKVADGWRAVDFGDPLTEDQRTFLGAQIERAVRRYVRAATVGFLILAAGIGISLSTKSDGAETAQLAQRLETASYAFCRRLNSEAAKTNLSDSVSFKILSLSSRRETALAEGQRSSPEIHARASRLMAAEGRKLGVTPLTDCDAAVGDPVGYVNPEVGPIGNPATGEIHDDAQKILDESRAYLKRLGA